MRTRNRKIGSWDGSGKSRDWSNDDLCFLCQRATRKRGVVSFLLQFDDKRSLRVGCLYADRRDTEKFHFDTALNQTIFRGGLSDRRTDSSRGRSLSLDLSYRTGKFGATNLWRSGCKHMSPNGRSIISCLWLVQNNDLESIDNIII
jgi:hypothetical protein